jgi:methyltransferase-like protein/2-polyprenyl-3-methyl-5-hydroxy-6-metoxy-1,4-benzoquinol methylase
MTESMTAYDEVDYPGHPFVETHPDHLAVLGSLYGMTPVPLRSCRVLELGCGVGANLIPMAFDAPDSKFIGIDLSAESVRRGNASIAKMGLSNIELRAYNIMDVTPDFGTFDYIVAHGVYSWVPDFVRDKILAIYRQNLSPQGIAFVSYNAYPGCFLRDIARHIMRYHVRDESDPRARVEQSCALMQFLAEASAQDSIYGVELRDQFERVKNVTPHVLYHDDLSDVATPFFLYQVAEAGGKHGLQYLCDSAFSMAHLGRLTAKARERLAGIPETEAVTREQYIDFVDGRTFRESLFCHAEVKLTRPIDPRRVMKLQLATSAAAGTDIDPAAPDVVTFKTENGSTLSTDHRLSKAVIRVLGRCWPQSKSFPEAVSEALAELGAAGDKIKENIAEETDALAGLIFRAFAAGQFQLRFSPHSMTTALAERPISSGLARKQAESGLVVTNLLHRDVSMKDETVRQFLMLVDGTRTVDQLVADLNAIFRRTGNPEVTEQGVLQNLGLLAKLGLLVA